MSAKLSNGIVLAALLVASPALAQVVGLGGASDTTTSQVKAQIPLRGSSFYIRNATSLVTFDPGFQQMDDPMNMFAIGLLPFHKFGDYYVRGWFELQSELTNNNFTTHRFVESDINLAVGAPRFYVIPVAEIGLSSEVGATIGTGLLSRGASNYGSVNANITLDHGFDVLGGLTLSTTVDLNKSINGYKNGSKDFRLQCAPNDNGCRSWVSDGSRATNWTLTNNVTADLGLLSWLSTAASVSLFNGFLYGLGDDDRVSAPTPGGPTNRQVFMSSRISVTARPSPNYAFIAGFRSFHGQLAMDGTYRAPLFNRMTLFTVDVRLQAIELAENVLDLF